MANPITPRKAKIMVAFPFVKGARFGISLGDACADGLEQLGFEVIRAGTTFYTDKRLHFRIAGTIARCIGIGKQRMPWMERNRLHRALCNLIAAERPDYLLTISTIALDQRTLDFARSHGLKKSIGWCVEGPSWIEERPDDPGKYDHYFTQFDNGCFTKLDTLGFAPDLYRPLKDLSKGIQIVFVGRYETRRERYLKAILDQGLVIYGPRWNSHGDPSLQSCLRGEEIWGEEINRLYNRAKIVLNIPSWAPSYADTPNLRIVDVPATGSFLLTEDSEMTRRIFTPGEHIDIFSSPEELRDKVDFYLTHDAAREKIARAGYARVQELDSYREKMRYLLKCCEIPCGDRT